MTVARPRPPSTLGRAGAALWRRLTAPLAPDEALVFSASELVVLESACKTADVVAQLERVLRRDGPIVTGSQGQPRVNGVLAELRQQRAALTKLVRQLPEPSEPEAGGGGRDETATQRRARRAAEVRWAQQPKLDLVRKHG